MSVMGEVRRQIGVNLGADWNGFFISSFFQGVMKQDWYPAPESRFWGQYNRPYNTYPSWHQDNMYREELQNYDAYLPRLVGYIAQGGRALGVANDTGPALDLKLLLIKRAGSLVQSQRATRSRRPSAPSSTRCAALDC